MRRVMIAPAAHDLIFKPEDLAAAQAVTPEGEVPVIDLTPEVPESDSVEIQPILMDPDRKVELESLLREHHRLMLGGEKLPPPNDNTRRVLAMKCPRCNTKSTPIYGTVTEIGDHAVRTAGFKKVGDLYYCRKCCKKIKV